LVNAHCHLDYTNMAGQFPPPKIFTDWLKLITATKSGWGFSDYAESWLAGSRMLVQSGTTTVGDIEAVPELLPTAWEATPLRVFSFLELISITGRREPEAIVTEAAARINYLKSPRCRAWLSPHAPYSTLPKLLRLSAQTARRRRWRLCTHVAESALEFEMFVHGRGRMFDWLLRSSRDMSDCGHGTPVQHLFACDVLGANVLAVHANYLRPRDVALLARKKVNVVHCPRSHAYFAHDPFPMRRLLKAGVNVCLGTDSLASVFQARRQTVTLNMFEEMRAVARSQPSLSPKTIFKMSTLNGARALGLTGRAGELSKGCFADLITIPFAGKSRDIHDAILQHPGDVRSSLINGQWAIAP
jgi:cytosine/adenosine deaminase-related metal-dependent hydrolase